MGGATGQSYGWGEEGSKIYSKIARETCPLSAVLLDVNFSCTVEYGPTARLAAVEYYGTSIVRLSFRIFIGEGGKDHCNNSTS